MYMHYLVVHADGMMDIYTDNLDSDEVVTVTLETWHPLLGKWMNVGPVTWNDFYTAMNAAEDSEYPLYVYED